MSPARRPRDLLTTALCAVLLSGCVPALPSPDAPSAGSARTDAPRDATVDDPLPAGHGTLRQDAFSILLSSGAVQVRITPLAEQVIRLGAPDTHERLAALARSRLPHAQRAVASADPGLFLVAFFSHQPDTDFQPEDLSFEQQGRIHRPRAILPLTSDWGSQRLRAQEAQSAVYVFDAALDPALPFEVRYGHARSDAWTRILERLEIERARVRSRPTP